MRLGVRSRVAIASVLVGAIGCQPIVESGTLGDSIGVIVSAPVNPALGAAGAAGRASVAAANGVQLVYVSLAPGSVPMGAWATITNLATRLSTTTAVVNGGFDPVPIAASVGDTLTVEITGSGAPVEAQVVVAAARPLKIVRTSPPSGGRDVPLNAVIVVVFSEPIDPATSTTGTVQLWRDTTPVAGTVRVADALQLSVEFHPASLLTAQTDYRLVVTQGIRDVNGVPVAATIDVPFTTGSAGGTAATLVVSGLPSDVGVLCDVVVSAKDALGNIATGYTGTVHFTATDPAAVLPPDYTFVGVDAGTHTFPITFKTAGRQAVTVTDFTSSLSGGQAVTVPALADKPLYVSIFGGVSVYAAGASCNPTIFVRNGWDAHGIALDAAGRLYVAIDGADSTIAIYAARRATATIAGSNTGLGFPRGITLDAAGRLYVTNVANQLNNSITVYAAGAMGNIPPTVTIAGSNTGLNHPWGIALDGAGQLYVTNGNDSTINVYAAGATGNATPMATIAGNNTGLAGPYGIALDAAGRVYVANIDNNTITVYAAGATGNATPTATIAGSNTGLNGPAGIALDAAGQLYVVNINTQRITVYAAGATGNVTPMATLGPYNTPFEYAGFTGFITF